MLAIKNGKIITVTRGIIEKGTVLIEDGKIKSVGKSVKIPKGAEVIDATGKTVTPGFIEAHGHISVSQTPKARSEITDLNETSSPNTCQVRALDALNPFDASIPSARRGGLTSFCSLPGSANICGGTGIVYKLKDASTVYDMIYEGSECMKFAMGENPRGVYNARNTMPKTRMGCGAVLRETLFNAKNYSDLKLAHEKDPSVAAPKPDFKLEALVPVIRRQMKARIHCHRADDIVTAIRIAKEFDLDFSIEHATEGHKIADYLAKEGVVCVVGPVASSPYKSELHGTTIRNAAILAKAGVEICLQVDGGYLEYMLPIYAGLAVAYGLPEDTAFRAITINPAKLLGIADRVGSIEAGKDADIAIFNGHPFCPMTRCEKTIIDGVVYDNMSSI
ncbi:MAG: amidohydrolase [Clostridia bacterium]|nr:amidohydrolase [Clostridia bacterium]